MKRTVSVFLLFIILGSGAVAAPASKFTGLIINISDSTIEIKKGRKEIILQLTDDSKILHQGKEAGRDSIKLCQRVNAKYVIKSGRREIVSLEIMQDGYCD